MHLSLRPALRSWSARSPKLRELLRSADDHGQCLRGLAYRAVPALLRPRTKNLTIALTARCNLRCEGCRYERDFMLGSELPTALVKDLLTDAAAAKIPTVRLYGGEPLLHPDLPEIVAHAVERGLDTYVTTNATLLDKRIDALHAAGLRQITFGFYGTRASYDAYVSRKGAFERVRRSIATVRERYGRSVQMRMNWLLMRPTANPESVAAVLEFAREHATPIQIDLIHYSLPYFSEGLDQRLQFTSEDRPALEAVVSQLLAARRADPELIEHSEIGLRSIPDWLILGTQMKVPCTKHDMLWIGADGTVQLCYVKFKLGNLHETRLRDLLYGQEHVAAARGAFRLDCPNCHCGYDARTRSHLPSRLRYR